MSHMAGSLYYESDPYYHAGLHVDVDISVVLPNSFNKSTTVSPTALLLRLSIRCSLATLLNTGAKLFK